jgi:tetratricopeptide (TPR) repeat protein
LLSVLTLGALLGFFAFAAGPTNARPLEGRREALALLAEGQEALRNGRVDEATKLLERSVELAPSPAAYYNLGQAYRKAGNKSAAVEAFRKALELSPDFELAKQALREIGGAAGKNSPENFDAVVSEQETISSLRRADAHDAAEAKPAILSLGALLPKPQKILGSAKAAVPKPGPAASIGSARDAVIPSQPVEIVNEVPTREIVSAAVEKSQRRGRPALTQNEAETAQPSTVAPVSLWRGKREAPRKTENPANPAEPKLHRGTRQSTAGATEASAPPDASAVNQAAFSDDAEAGASKPPKRFGNPTNILLGTFAFHREKADNYRQAQRWIEAADEYQQALKKNPDDVETRALLAECLARAGEVDVAEEQFRRALAMDPNDPRVLFRMGNTYRELKRYDAAIKAYRQALNSNPNDVVIRNNLGVVYMESGAYTKATQEFKKVLEINPKYENAALNLGILYDEHLGDPKQALHYYQMYVDLGGKRAKEVQKWIEDLTKKAK